MKIIEAITSRENAREEIWQRHETVFVRRDLISVHRYVGSICITDLTHAMKPGKICTQINIGWDHHQQNLPALPLDLLEANACNLQAVLNELLKHPWVAGKYGYPEITVMDRHAGQISLVRRDFPSSRRFSPFATLKPLTEIPSKWTLPHAIRCLFNGQFEKLICDGVYTDDYAYDNAVRFQKGDFSDRAMAFVWRVYESPSGWWVGNERDGRVGINCHTFDTNSFTPKLDMRFNPFASPGAPATAPVPASSPTKSKRKGKTPDSPLAGKVRAISPKVLHAMLAGRTVLTEPQLHEKFIEFCQARTDADWRNAWAAFVATLALAEIPPQRDESETVTDKESPAVLEVDPSALEPITQTQDPTIVIPVDFTPPAESEPVAIRQSVPEQSTSSTVADRWRQRLLRRLNPTAV